MPTFLSSRAGADCVDINDVMDKWAALVVETENGASFCHQCGGVSALQVQLTGTISLRPSFIPSLVDVCYGIKSSGDPPLFREMRAGLARRFNTALPPGWSLRPDDGNSPEDASWEALVRLVHADGVFGYLLWENSD